MNIYYLYITLPLVTPQESWMSVSLSVIHQVDPKHVPVQDLEFNQYLYLVAMSSDPQLFIFKKVKILLSYMDKIVLLQTDKPIYTPLQTGK